MGNILIVAELTQDGAIRDSSLEVVALARKLADATGRGTRGLVLGSGVGEVATAFAAAHPKPYSDITHTVINTV